jgi:heat shock protein HslJ
MIEVIALSALLLQASAEQPRVPAPEPADAPYEGDWIVEVIDNIKVMPDSRVTLTIREGVARGVWSISGAASCNTYQGTLRVTDSGVRIGQLFKTMKYCDPARMSEERDFFLLLPDVVGYEVRGEQTLVLRTQTGKAITARRASPTTVPR